MSRTLSQALGATDYGRFPVLIASPMGAAAFSNYQKGNSVEGFAGDGDYIDLPITVGSNVEYFNAAGVSQWTVSRGNVDAAIDHWAGFFFDDNLIYVVGVDTGTSPRTYYTASIDSSGTVVNIGNDQPVSDFNVGGGNEWWNTSVFTGASSSSIQREAVGSGNILMYALITGGWETMTISIANGSILLDPSETVDTASTNLPWLSQSGIFIAVSLGGASNVVTMNAGSYGSQFMGDDIRSVIGVPRTGNYIKMTQWKNSVVNVDYDSAGFFAETRTWELLNFNAFVNDLHLASGAS